jgi:hypothetical protein
MQPRDDHVPDAPRLGTSKRPSRTSLSSPGTQSRHPATVITASTETSRPPTHHLNQIDLSRRWRISPRTLERWRWLGIGPRYIKIGGRVVYRLEDIETFETARVHG